MNKLQIKAEILATLRAFMSSDMPDPSLLTDLKNIEDKKAVLDILIRELINADEHKTLLICWLLTELIDKEKLNDELWNVIKSPDYSDHIKMVAFNMLKDLGCWPGEVVVNDLLRIIVATLQSAANSPHPCHVNITFENTK